MMLEFHAATRTFGSVRALDACTFTARPGRITGFLGPNGAGKTTAMRAVFGLVELDSGAVTWNGHTITTGRGARFGYMPEERGLYPRMRVRDQLVYLGRLCGRIDARGRGAAWTSGSSGSASRTERLTGSTRSRTATSSGSSSSRRSSTSPSCSCSTNRSPGSTRSPSPTCPTCSPSVAAAGATVLFSSHQLDLVEDLCEDVVIIDHGRVVLAGELDRAPSRGPATLRRHPLPRHADPTGPTLDRRRASSSRATATPACSVDRDIDLAAIVARVAERPDVVSFTLPAADALGAVPPGGRGMNGVRQGWLVAERELRERSRSRAFLASLVIMIVAVVGRDRAAQR